MKHLVLEHHKTDCHLQKLGFQLDMKPPKIHRLSRSLSTLSLLALFAPQLCAQGTAFTYQGRLNSSASPAVGLYDFRFRLATDSLGNNYVGSSILTNGIPVTNGLFTALLDFGAGAFTGPPRWLEVAVRTNGGSSYTILTPLQPVTPSPYAIYAPHAGTATTATGVAPGSVTGPGIASSTITAGNIASGQVVKSLNGLADDVTLASGANISITPSGSTLTISGTGGGSVTNPVFRDSVAVNAPITITNNSYMGLNNQDSVLLFTNGAHIEFVGGSRPGAHVAMNYLMDHGGVFGMDTPELHVNAHDASVAWYYLWWQWGDWGMIPTFQQWTSARINYVKGGVTNPYLQESSYCMYYESPVYINGGTTKYFAGSANTTTLPATQFRSTSTNGSGAWIWYDSLSLNPQGSPGSYHRDYDTAIERFRITAGPDGGATLKGPMVADEFKLSTGQSLSAGTIIATGATNLNAGAVVVQNLNVAANSVILLTYGSQDGTLASIGEDVRYRVPGSSFTVKSSNANDTNLVSWSLLPGSYSVVYDADALSFFNRAGIGDLTQRRAIDSLVTSLKTANLWNSMDVIYPFVGGTAASHLANLKSASYGIAWHGGLTHNSAGVRGDGATGYGDTGYVPSTSGQTTSSAHYYVFQTLASPLPAPETYGAFLACSTYTTLNWLGDILTLGNHATAMGGPNSGLQTTAYVAPHLYASGHSMITRTNAAGALWINADYVSYAEVPERISAGLATTSATLLAFNMDGVITAYSPGNLAFASMGKGLTQAQANSYMTIVSAFESALGR